MTAPNASAVTAERAPEADTAVRQSLHCAARGGSQRSLIICPARGGLATHHPDYVLSIARHLM